MPCYSVILNSVEFKVENIDLLKKALAAIKATINFVNDKTGVSFRTIDRKNIQINFNQGKLTGENMSENEVSSFTNSLKREYSKQVIDQIARKNNWFKKQLSENKIQLQRY